MKCLISVFRNMLLPCCLLPGLAVDAQSADEQSAAVKTSHYTDLPANALYIGLGTGMDFGGNGIKLEFKPVNRLGIFASGGHNLFSFTYEAGLKWTILPHNQPVQPFVLGMYGYNTLNWFKKGDEDDYGKTYYGFTSGAGCDVLLGKRRNHLSLALLVPIRDKETQNKAVTPVSLSLGFSFRL